MVDATIRDNLSPEARERLATAAGRSGMSEDEVIALVVENTLAPQMLLDDEEVEEISQAVAEADAGGPFISSAAMGAWIRSLGTDHELAPPEPDISF